MHFGTIDITEFPYWSMLFADLHPHLMGLPFFGTVIALVVSYAATVRARLRAQSWVIAGLLGAAVGLVRTVHTWDFPTAVLIASVGIPFGQLLTREGRWQRRFLGRRGASCPDRRHRGGGVRAVHGPLRNV